jgi:hypothetical protein
MQAGVFVSAAHAAAFAIEPTRASYPATLPLSQMMSLTADGNTPPAGKHGSSLRLPAQRSLTCQVNYIFC